MTPFSTAPLFKICPWHHGVHLVKELALAGLLGGELEIEGDLFHGLYDAGLTLRQTHYGGGFAELPKQSPLADQFALIIQVLGF